VQRGARRGWQSEEDDEQCAVAAGPAAGDKSAEGAGKTRIEVVNNAEGRGRSL
jgi:hypothetical protein